MILYSYSEKENTLLFFVCVHVPICVHMYMHVCACEGQRSAQMPFHCSLPNFKDRFFH